jgi:uncharacterized damage-inducible protein DinB
VFADFRRAPLDGKEFSLATETAIGHDMSQGWERYQDLLIRAITPLTPEQLSYRTAPHLRNVDETCRHVIGARARWCQFALALADPALPTLGQWDAKDMPARTSAELADGLRATWAVLQSALETWTPADLAQTIPNTAPEPGEPDFYSRHWVIWHLIEHDLHHGGEITEIIGAQGVPGVDV